VSFSLGVKYKDKMWCDVVAMDACHLLLGRPSQYDRSAHHDGRKNTYSFMIGNVKIMLLPSTRNNLRPTKEAGHFQSLLEKHEEEGERCRGGTTPEDDDMLPDQSYSRGPGT
jgi:hypothetical protein